MKFLIAGYGSIGRRHMRNLLALGEKDIVLYRTRNSTLTEEELVGFPVETDLDAALAHRPDAVIISNPTALHLDVAIPAARAGCSILMEKPVSHSLERMDALKSALAQGGGALLVGFQFRFHPGLQQVARWLAEEAAGRPVAFHAQWGEYLPGWHPWEDYRKSYSARGDLGGGVVLTLSHPLDYLRWLLGEVGALWSFAGQFSDLEVQVDDVAEIGLRFKQGTAGSLHLNYIQRPPVHRLEIVCSGGTITWDNADGAAHLFQADPGTWTPCPLPAGFERNDLFLAELRHFIAVTRGDEKPVCTLEDGIKALELALAVHASANQKCMVEFPAAANR